MKIVLFAAAAAVALVAAMPAFADEAVHAVDELAYGTNLTNEIGLTEGNPRAGQFISSEQGAQFYLGRSFRVAVLYRF
jgi:hypothetical protein